MFKITRGRGFHITFENGYTVSVQFGEGTYSDNHHAEFGSLDDKRVVKSGSAECAVWHESVQELMALSGWDDTVKGWMNPKEVLNLLKWAERQKPKGVKT